MRSKLLVTILLMMASPVVTFAQGNMEPFKVGTFEINGAPKVGIVLRDSLIVERIRESDESLRMPPEGEPLTAEQIRLIERWIAQGAVSPQNERPEEDPRNHWAFQEIVRPPVPNVGSSQRVRNPIDVFIAAQHKSHGLVPLESAEKQVLLRRV